MPLLIIYILKLSISLAVVYLFYQFVLRRLTFYNSNRLYLLGYTLLSFFIPFINIASFIETDEASNNTVLRFIPSIETYTNEAGENALQVALPSSPVWDKWDWMLLVFAIGASFLLSRFLIRYISFLKLRNKATLIYNGNVKLYQVEKDIIPFSFGGSIFINGGSHNDEELKEIIRHEFVHVKQKHTIDIIWVEILCMLNWYNPFAWLLKTSIRQNLEFIADNKVLENGIDRKQYQYLLLKVTGNNHFSIAQKFNFSSLKKRIAMMNKMKTARIHLLRFLFILPLLAVILISFRQKNQDSLPPQKNSSGYFVTDTIPDEPNEKGYIIDVIGKKSDANVVVKDKNGKLVERIPFSKWKENEKGYEDKYGELPQPPLPPLPPDPPAPPKPIELPDNVRNIDVNNKKATVTLKDGTIEKYDLNKADEKAAFEKKYGEILPLPPVPPKPAREYEKSKTSFLQRNPDIKDLSWRFDGRSHLIVSKKEGNDEIYHLDDPDSKAKAEKKYGELPIPEKFPVIGYSVRPEITAAREANRSTVADNFEITNDNKASVRLKDGTVEKYPVSVLTTVGIKTAITSGSLVNASVNSTVTNVAANPNTNPSVGITSTSNVKNATTIISPVAATDGISVADNHGYAVTGREDILVTITRNTTADQLEEFKRKMKEKGIELNFDNATFNSKGILTHINGTMKSDDVSTRFSATDFKEVILATMREGNRTYFKVHVRDNKSVVI